jgi:hypothetical protein
MERRTFLSLVGAAGLPAAASVDGGLVLIAIAAESLPQTAILHNPPSGPQDGILEMREYEATPPSAELLTKHGIRVLFHHDGGLLVSFADLARRDSCWSSVTADPEWRKAPSTPRQITLYKTAGSSTVTE